jgi:hypothetical protein
MVSEYTSLKLMRESDIFPALSGIVKQMQRFRNDEYIAGLWKDSILEDLLWQADKPASRPALDLRAPSWSWASVVGAVSYNNMPEYGHARVVDVDCTPAGSDPTGELSCACLMLSCCLLPATLKYTDSPSAYLIEKESEIEDARLYFAPDYCFCNPGNGNVPDRETVYCLNFSSDQPENGEIHNRQYLVLRSLDASAGVYERIGLLRESWRAGAKNGWTVQGLVEDVVITIV